MDRFMNEQSLEVIPLDFGGLDFSILDICIFLISFSLHFSVHFVGFLESLLFCFSRYSLG